MFFGKSETEITAEKSFLSKASGNDSSEINLLSETNQTFQDWLEGLSTPSTAESGRHNSSNYSPRTSREINFEGTLTVDGYLSGVVYSPEGILILGENGEIDGDIFVKAAIIHGAVRGDIHATLKVELTTTCKVIGEIETLNLAIKPGAVFEGRCVFPRPATDDQPDLALAVAD